MNALLHAWSVSPLVHRICWALIHSLWEGIAVALLLVAVRALMRGCSASARHGAACVALLVFAACPVVTFAWMDRAQPSIVTSSARVEVSAERATPVVSEPSIMDAGSIRPAEPIQRSKPIKAPRRLRWEFWVVVAWMGGLGLLAMRHVVGWAFLQRLRRVGVSPLQPAMAGMVARLRRMLGLRRPVVVQWSDRVQSPSAFGWWRPIILLPLSLASGLSAQQWELILLHEMAHLRRHDYLINLMQTGIETLLFYHPVTWWISRQIRIEREHACDDAAARLSDDRLGYAGALTKLAELELSLPSLALGAGASRHELYARIARLLRPAPSRFALRPLFGGLGASVVITGIIGAMAAYPSHAQSKGGEEPIRGDILDRNGVLLATTDKPDRQIVFSMPDVVKTWIAGHGKELPTYQARSKVKNEDKERTEVDYARILDEAVTEPLQKAGLAMVPMPESLTFAARRMGRYPGAGYPLVYRSWLSEDEFKSAEASKAGIPGMGTRIVKRRRYPLEAVAAHVVGYAISERYSADDTSIEDLVARGLDSTRGGVGTEKAWDNVLKAKLSPQSSHKRGDDIYLTLDTRHQMIVEQALRDAGVGRGAAVLTDVKTSDVLAMASVPSFDPNIFAPSISVENFQLLNNDKTYPLLSRATRAFAPGSAFCTVTSLAAVCAGHERDSYTCEGEVKYGTTSMRCWIARTGGKHGALTLDQGLVNSCNCYFYQLGVATGADRMDEIGGLLRIGQKTDIGLREEDAGIMPGPKWFAQQEAVRNPPSNTKVRWTDRQTANAAIGQGYALVTPLQMADVMCTIANDGVVWRPRLLDRTVSSADKSVSVQPKVREADLREHGLTASGLELIRKGLYDAVYGGAGSASSAASKEISIAGRSGTAQYWRAGGVSGDKMVTDNIAHFVGYAPADKPRWALAVLVQGAKSGGAVAAPIARRILEQVAALEAGQLNVEIKPLPPVKGHFDIIEEVKFSGEAE